MTRSARDIAGYRLVAGLGEGGMARVYLALSKKAAGFSKLVVLKVLRSSTTEDPELRRMFFDEARIAALLNHPNVVQTYEAGEDEGRLFLAMEYLEGKSLSTLIAAGKPRELTLDVHLRIIADMLEGLHYAHGVADVDGAPLDIIHRDVSPQNVLVTFAGQSKVVDFGIAKVAGSPATQSGIIKGKVGYMAPEQIHNKNADRRADVFAAGVMIWEAIARRRMVRRGEDEVATIARRMNGEDPSIRTAAPPGTPEELLAICDKAMSPKPDDRYATELELHDALDRYLRASGGVDQKRVAEFLEAGFGVERRKSRAFVEEQLRVADDSAPLIDMAKHRAFAQSDPPRPAALPAMMPGLPPVVPGSHLERKSSATSSPQVADVVPPTALSKATIALIVFAAFAVVGTLLIVTALVGHDHRASTAAALGTTTSDPEASSTAGAATASGAASASTAATASDAPTASVAAAESASGTSAPASSMNRDLGPSRGANRLDGGAGDKRKKRPIDDGDPYRR